MKITEKNEAEFLVELWGKEKAIGKIENTIKIIKTRISNIKKEYSVEKKINDRLTKQYHTTGMVTPSFSYVRSRLKEETEFLKEKQSLLKKIKKLQ